MQSAAHTPASVPAVAAGRAALVIGGTGRIGRAVVAAVAAGGHDVAVHCHAALPAARELAAAGIEVEVVKKLQEGHPNLIDHLIDGTVQLIFNTPRGKGARTDEGRIRAASVLYGVPCITTLPAAEACVRAMEGMRKAPLSVQPIQDRFSEATASAR